MITDENGAKSSRDVQASSFRFVALHDHVLNDDIKGEGDRTPTRVVVETDGVSTVGRSKEVPNTRGKQVGVGRGNSGSEVGVLHELQFSIKIGSHKPNHRGLSVRKSTTKNGARIRKLTKAIKSMLLILGEWVNSISWVFSNPTELSYADFATSKENAHAHQELVEAPVH
ncbi:hypothetical protein V6N13_053652 [Hibiscus sabdariffa]